MSRIDPLLLKFVRTLASPCPICRRSLAGMEADRCPHCGEDLVLDVAMSDPCTRHLVLGAVGLGVGFGFCTSLAAILMVQILNYPNFAGSAAPDLLRFLPLFLGVPVLGVALIVWIRSRRRIRSASGRRRWLGVLACWLLTAGFVGWLAVNIILES
jgi:hypothetical protein